MEHQTLLKYGKNACTDALQTLAGVVAPFLSEAMTNACEDLSEEEQLDQAMDFFEAMRLRGIVLNTTTCNALVTACEKSKQPERAVEVFTAMQQQRVVPNSITYKGMSNACIKASQREKALGAFEKMACSREYSVVGSWSGFDFQDMIPDVSDQNTFWRHVILTQRGGEFQIVRNRNKSLSIHPPRASSECAQVSPVIGPDDEGRGLNWCLKGNPGDVFRIVLKQLQGTRGPSTAVHWELVYHKTFYYIVGSWNNWDFQKMLEDEANPGVFSLDTVLTKHGEEFQIVRDRDWEQVLHPSHKRSQS